MAIPFVLFLMSKAGSTNQHLSLFLIKCARKSSAQPERLRGNAASRIQNAVAPIPGSMVVKIRFGPLQTRICCPYKGRESAKEGPCF